MLHREFHLVFVLMRVRAMSGHAGNMAAMPGGLEGGRRARRLDRLTVPCMAAASSFARWSSSLAACLLLLLPEPRAGRRQCTEVRRQLLTKHAGGRCVSVLCARLRRMKAVSLTWAAVSANRGTNV